MKEQTQLKNPSSSNNQSIAAKPIWQKPLLIMVGKLRDIVQGGGKTGTSTDQESAKPSGLG